MLMQSPVLSPGDYLVKIIMLIKDQLLSGALNFHFQKFFGFTQISAFPHLHKCFFSLLYMFKVLSHENAIINICNDDDIMGFINEDLSI